MSRPAAQRSLTLTEELERLEQQITLTLQEIDSNFSKAHRIVTTSILPIVEEYAKHSNEVWEGSKVCMSIQLNAETVLTRILVLEAILRGVCQCLAFRLRGEQR